MCTADAHALLHTQGGMLGHKGRQDNCNSPRLAELCVTQEAPALCDLPAFPVQVCPVCLPGWLAGWQCVVGLVGLPAYVPVCLTV